MRFPRKRFWPLVSTAAMLMTLNFARAQQQNAAPNPYLKGSGSYDKGPQGLTSYQPIAIDQPFATRMAHDVAAEPGTERGIELGNDEALSGQFLDTAPPRSDNFGRQS